MSFQTTAFIPFDQADPGGIVYFANHFAYAHRAIESFIEESGIGWQQWFKNESFGVPLVHAEASYKSMVTPGQSYSFTVKLTSIGNSSVSFQTTIKTDEEIHSQIQTTHVFVDLNTKKKINIPIKIKAILEANLA